MKFLTLSILLLLSLHGKAQADYTIEYIVASGIHFDENGDAYYSHKKSTWLYIYADTLSFYSYQQGNRGMVEIGKKEYHHGIIHFLATDSTF